jgi:ParB family chromosome partitioning protein
MSTGTVSTTQDAVRADAVVWDIPPAQICESKTNPRSHVGQDALAELAANIEQHGVLQPVLLRPRPNGAPDTYELVVGS